MWLGDPIEHKNWPYGVLTDDPGKFVFCSLDGRQLAQHELEDGSHCKIRTCKTMHEGYEYMCAGGTFSTEWIWFDEYSTTSDEQVWKLSKDDAFGEWSFENVAYPGQYLGYDDSKEDYLWLCLKDSPDLWWISD